MRPLPGRWMRPLQPLADRAVEAALAIGLRVEIAPAPDGDEPGPALPSSTMRLRPGSTPTFVGTSPPTCYRGPLTPAPTPGLSARLRRRTGAIVLGDLALAGETVVREAEAEGKTVPAHLSHLIIHGVLHLLGYDHIEEEQAELMEGLERRAMEQLGYSDPYGDSTDAQ